MSANTAVARLDQRIDEIQRKSGAEEIAVALYDLETGIEYGRDADRWFHAASTIKIAILLGVFHGLHTGELVHHSRVQVRNRFLSAHDGEPFRVSADRDANSAVHAALWKTMRIEELASHMIVTSSNLATNLLLDLIGLEHVQNVLLELGIHGIDVRRGVEDERAFEHGIINRVTANGLVDLLRLVAEDRAYSPALSREMLEILHDQEFNGGIPARLPKGVRVAHKTGDISTIAHDAGIVYVPDRKPYILSVLTEWSPDTSGRSATIAAISYAVYEFLLEEAARAG